MERKRGPIQVGPVWTCCPGTLIMGAWPAAAPLLYLLIGPDFEATVPIEDMNGFPSQHMLSVSAAEASAELRRESEGPELLPSAQPVLSSSIGQRMHQNDNDDNVMPLFSLLFTVKGQRPPRRQQ